MRVIATLALLLLLFACATPRTVMRNAETGQVAQCGGSATGSFVGGVLVIFSPLGCQIPGDKTSVQAALISNTAGA